MYYYTYVLRSKKDGLWYTGCTGDLRKRLSDHLHGYSIATKGRGPFEIIYIEVCRSQQDAFYREKYLKTGLGKRYLRSRLKRFLTRTG